MPPSVLLPVVVYNLLRPRTEADPLGVATDTAVSTYAVVATVVLLVSGAAVGAVGVPVNAGLARGARGTICSYRTASPFADAAARPVTLLPPMARLPLMVSPDLRTRRATAVSTYSVLAAFVEASPADWLGTTTVPVNVGLARGATVTPIWSLFILLLMMSTYIVPIRSAVFAELIVSFLMTSASVL